MVQFLLKAHGSQATMYVNAVRLLLRNSDLIDYYLKSHHILIINLFILKESLFCWVNKKLLQLIIHHYQLNTKSQSIANLELKENKEKTKREVLSRFSQQLRRLTAYEAAVKLLNSLWVYFFRFRWFVWVNWFFVVFQLNNK